MIDVLQLDEPLSYVCKWHTLKGYELLAGKAGLREGDVPWLQLVCCQSKVSTKRVHVLYEGEVLGRRWRRFGSTGGGEPTPGGRE